MFTGVCLSMGGAWSWRVPGPGKVPGPGGWCLVLGGPGGEPLPRKITAVGGTHPTGMHSC